MLKNKARLNLRQRVLIADYDTHFGRRLSDYFWDHGFEARVVHTVAEAKTAVQSWRPDSIFINLILPSTNALTLVNYIHSKEVKQKPIITIMSKQNVSKSMNELRKSGVVNVLLKPFPLEEALRIVEDADKKQLERAHSFLPASPGTAGYVTVAEDSVKEMHLLTLILKQASLDSGIENRMFNLMRMINIKVKGIRSSLVKWVDDERAVVLASNDDENITGLPLDLKQYPELINVKKTGRTLIIADVGSSEVLASVKGKIASTPFETIVLCPIYQHGLFFGVLSLRMERREAVQLSYVEKFGEVCSQIIGLSLPNLER